jgi:hypothetical protein
MIDQVNGISQRNPEVELPLLPFACQAAWQLQQWSVLDDLLCRVEDKNLVESETSLQSHSDDKFYVSVSYVVSCLQKGEKSSFDQALNDARTMVLLPLLTCLSFSSTSLSQVMASLSSASLESYNRSYPYLMQLHILREVEHSYQFVHCSLNESHSGSHQSDSLNLQSWHHPPHTEGSLDLDQTTIPLLARPAAQLLARRHSMIKRWDWEGRYHMLSPSAGNRAFVLAMRRCILDLCDMRENVADNWLTVR